MKVLGNTTLTKDTDNKYPFGANLQDETSTVNGTPVVREIYGDILMNAYRLLELTNEVPNGSEDNKNTQFQLVNALKKLANNINDVNHVLALDGTTWNLPIDLDILPNKFVCFAQASENYSKLVTYQFKGTGTETISFTSNGFSASDQLFIIIENSLVKAISLTYLNESTDSVYTTYGQPLLFNDTKEMMYFVDGKILKEQPSVFDLQDRLRLFESEGTLIVHNVFLHNDKLICICSFDVSVSEKKYIIYDINAYNFNDISSNYSFGTIDPSPEIYSYIDIYGNLYFSNEAGLSNDDYKISKYTRNLSGIFEFNSTIEFDNLFEKTLNSVINGDYIYTFRSGVLNRYSLLTGDRDNVMTLPIDDGQLFRFNGGIYYTNGEVARKWKL